MKPISVKLKRGQYLNEVEPFKSKGIPTNCILHKVIPGCGATTLEIKYTNRNSIIIVPNVPVIEDKVKEHNKNHPKELQIIGVHKGIDITQIEDYVNSGATYKKILTTPEGFLYKVIPAFENDLDTMKKDYFLLFDECERIVTDVSYRGKIALPIDRFLQFDNKAMVSATTLPFSHGSLSKFNHYVIEPQYDYSKKIKVVLTNNVIESTEARLKELQADNPIFLFLNSTEGIFAIADTLSIKNQSRAYCADKSVAKLVSKKYKNGSSRLETQDLAKYNFLTSRYFSAFDIKLKYKPDIILITDVFTASHSILDPHTEIIQIVGRFRNGFNTLTHITNFNTKIEAKTKDESLQYLKGCFDTYDNVLQLFSNAKDQGSQDTLKFFVEHSPIADFYMENKVNQFMVDNYLYQERVQGYYQNAENLKQAYAEQDKHFKTEFILEEYTLGDEDRVKRQSKSTIREQQWETLRQIDKLTIGSGAYKLTLSPTLLANLRSLYPWLTEAYDLLELEGLQKTGLATAKLNPAVARAKELKALRKLAPYVYAQFNDHSESLDSDLKLVIPELCQKANVGLNPTISLILRFFKGGRTTSKGVHIHRLREKIDLDTLTPFD